MLRDSQRILTVFALIVLASGWAGVAAHAAAYGRVTLIVKDDAGKPIKDVKVTVTCDDLENFLEEQVTNKKGKAIITFTDATRRYNFHIEHGAYPPQDLQLKPNVLDTITQEVTLSKSTAPASAPKTTTVFTPAEEVFNDGVRALQGGDMETAKSKFQRALQLDPEMALAHSAMAGVYAEEKDYDAALAAVDRLLQLDPENPRGYRIRYEVYTARGDKKQADAALKALSKLGGGEDAPTLFYNEGVQAVKVGDYETAKARFEEALGLQPDMATALSALAIIYVKEGSYQKAAEMAERHLAVKPGDPTSIRVRWDAYRMLGDTEKEKEAFDALKATDPAAVIKQFFDKGQELYNGGQTEQAAAEFERVLAVDPDHPRSHYFLGLIQVSSGDTDGAKAHFEKFLALAPEDPEAPTAKEMLSYLQ